MSPDGTMTGGILRGIEDGWFMAEIAEASFAYQQQLEKGEKKVVGVNCHTETVEKPVEILRVSHEVERGPGTRAGPAPDRPRPGRGGRRAGRDARGGQVRGEHDPADAGSRQAEATLGEICGALRDEWGGYFESACLLTPAGTG